MKVIYIFCFAVNKSVRHASKDFSLNRQGKRVWKKLPILSLALHSTIYQSLISWKFWLLQGHANQITYKKTLQYESFHIYTWQANAYWELQLRSDRIVEKILFLRMLRCRQFCWPPKLSGCPSCHLTKLLTKSELPFEVHHWNLARLVFSRLTPPVQKLWTDLQPLAVEYIVILIWSESTEQYYYSRGNLLWWKHLLFQS